MNGVPRKRFKLSDDGNDKSASCSPSRKRKSCGETRLEQVVKKSQELNLINSKFITAVRKNDLSTVKVLIKSVDIFKPPRWEMGYLLLCETAISGYEEVFKSMLSAGACVNVKRGFKQKLTSPLHCAVKAENLNFIKLLLSSRADVNVFDEFDRTPLHEAIAAEHVDIVKLLLSHGANVNDVDESCSTSLHMAVRQDNFSIVCELLKYKPMLNALDASCRTALFYAVENGSVKIVEQLLMNGANANIPDEHGVVPLHIAAACNKTEVVKDLLNTSISDKDMEKVLMEPLSNWEKAFGDQKQNHMKDKIKSLCCSNKSELASEISIDKFAATNIISKDKEAFGKVSAPTVDNVRKNVTVPTSHYGVIKTHYFKVFKSFLVCYRKFNEPCKYDTTKVKKNFLKIIKFLLDFKANVNITNDALSTPLHTAVKSNCVESVRLLVKHNANINVIDKCRKTPLIYAVALDNQVIVKLLLKSGADANISCQGIAPLHRATLTNSFIIIKELIAHKADVNQQDFYCRTPFFYSILRGQTEIIKYLIQCNAKINSVDIFDKVPLIYAIKKGFADIPKLLIKAGALSNISEKLKGSILTQAVAKNNFELVNDILKSGANVDTIYKTSSTLLHYTVKNNNKNMTKIFLNHKANINSINRHGKTPLFLAVERGLLEMVRVIISNGGNVNIVAKSNISPLQMAVAENNFFLVKELLQHKANVNFVNDFGENALLIAVRKKSLKLVELLLSNGADVNITNKSGFVPLHLACKQNNVELVKLLLNYGAKVNVGSKYGKTALMYAVISKNIEIVSVILDRKPNVNVVDKSMSSALHYAILYQDTGIIYELMMRHPDVNIVNKDGKSPLFLAVERNQTLIAEWLLKVGAFVNVCCEKEGFLTPIHIAALNGKYKMVRLLINAGANLTVATKCSLERTPLEFLIKGKYRFMKSTEKVVKLLLCHLVKLEKTSRGNNSNFRDLHMMYGYGFVKLYCEELKKEIDLMKDVYFERTSVCLYNIFVGSEHQLAKFLKHEEIRSRCQSDFFKKYLKENCTLLLDQVSKGKKRLTALNNATSKTNFAAVSKLLCKSVIIQYDIYEHILNYLGTSDINNLVEAARNSVCTHKS